MVKIWILPFGKNFEKITPPPIITKGGLELCNKYVKYFEKLIFLLNIFNQSTFLLLAFNFYKSEYSTLIRTGLTRDLRHVNLNKQKQGVVLIKKCSENVQQIYRSTPMPKHGLIKVAKQLYRNHTSAWVFSCKLAASF